MYLGADKAGPFLYWNFAPSDLVGLHRITCPLAMKIEVSAGARPGHKDMADCGRWSILLYLYTAAPSSQTDAGSQQPGTAIG